VKKLTNESFDLKNNTEYIRIGDYINCRTKISFLCPYCNTVWDALPKNILEGHGCPKCSVSGYKKNLPGHLYFIQINDFLKIGITNREPSLRYMQLTDTANITEIKVIYGDGNSIYDLEQLIHSKFSHYNPKSLKSGNTECFALSLKEDILLFLEKY